MEDISQKLGEITQWQRDHERHDDERFAAITKLMGNMPTKDDFGNLADKEDIARLNNIVHNFLLGIDFTQRFGKWGFRAILFVGSLITLIAIVKGWLIALVAWFGYQITHIH